jgi:hypothetical protein
MAFAFTAQAQDVAGFDFLKHEGGERKKIVVGQPNIADSRWHGASCKMNIAKLSTKLAILSIGEI